jgi:hypothetical protein
MTTSTQAVTAVPSPRAACESPYGPFSSPISEAPPASGVSLVLG